MSAAPGWYADPTVPGGVRWWDGFAWTSHVSAPQPPAGALSTGAVNPYALASNPYSYPAAAARASSKAWIGWVVGGVVAVFVLVAIAVPVARRQAERQPVTCGVVAPADAPEATKAYVAAVYQVNRAQADYTVYVNQHGGGGASVTPEMLHMYRTLQANYMDALAQIHFTGQAATDAADLVAENRVVLSDIDALLADRTLSNGQLHNDLEALNAKPLRVDLGLPFNSGCSFWQPA